MLKTEALLTDTPTHPIHNNRTAHSNTTNQKLTNSITNTTTDLTNTTTNHTTGSKQTHTNSAANTKLTLMPRLPARNTPVHFVNQNHGQVRNAPNHSKVTSLSTYQPKLLQKQKLTFHLQASNFA